MQPKRDFWDLFTRIVAILSDESGGFLERSWIGHIAQEINLKAMTSRFVDDRNQVEAPWIRVDFEPDSIYGLSKLIRSLPEYIHSIPSDILFDLLIADCYPPETPPSLLPSTADAPSSFNKSQETLQNLLPPKLPKPPDPSRTREQSDFCSSIAAVQRLSPLRLMSRRRITMA